MSRLTGHAGLKDHRPSATAALGILHNLAASPATAPDALALLHELQVHQVELDLQAEELHATRTELEENLARQVQLYDAAPVGLLTIDRHTTLSEVNLTGAHWLGVERDALPGRSLNDFLAPASASALRAMLARIGQGHGAAAGSLQLLQPEAVPRAVHAAVRRDPAGAGFLVALVNLGEDPALRHT